MHTEKDVTSNNSCLGKPRPCGCKGIRTCLKCESEHGLIPESGDRLRDGNTYVLCYKCGNLAWPGWSTSECEQLHPSHQGTPIRYDGVLIRPDFLSTEEERRLVDECDTQLQWDASQSGRRKQNYGPKCNFRGRKLKAGDFSGFPSFTRFVQQRLTTGDDDHPLQSQLMDGFQTIEQCHLEYDPANGASIDPHIDDCWVWGERVVSVSMLSDSVLTMTKYRGSIDKYNLNLIDQLPRIQFTHPGEKHHLEDRSSDGGDKHRSGASAEHSSNSTRVRNGDAGDQVVPDVESADDNKGAEERKRSPPVTHTGDHPRDQVVPTESSIDTAPSSDTRRATVNGDEHAGDVLERNRTPTSVNSSDQSSQDEQVVIRIPMPARSLLVLFGEARYSWEHRILREDITTRRICLAYREFTAPYLPGGDSYDSKGKEILDKAEQFF